MVLCLTFLVQVQLDLQVWSRYLSWLYMAMSSFLVELQCSLVLQIGCTRNWLRWHLWAWRCVPPDRPEISGHLTPFFAGQDHHTTRTKILCLDQWFYPCLTQHIPEFVVFQARVWQVGSWYCSLQYMFFYCLPMASSCGLLISTECFWTLLFWLLIICTSIQ